MRPADPPAAILPRQLLQDLEKLATAIHDLYNQKQLERHPDQQLEHPEFSDLPGDLKYSNLRQARGIARKLALMGWEMRPKGAAGKMVLEIPEEIVETLAALEHQEWMRERFDAGWTLGDVRDTKNRTSPHLVPYEQLSENIKELDRDTIRNIPLLLDKIGRAIYVRELDFQAPGSDPLLARRLPDSYTD